MDCRKTQETSCDEIAGPRHDTVPACHSTAGGRTGIVAIVCGTLMVLSVFLTPLVALVPVVATSGLLVYVGFLLLPLQEIAEKKFTRFDTIVDHLMVRFRFSRSRWISRLPWASERMPSGSS